MIYKLQISYFSIYYESTFSENWALQAISLVMMDFIKSKEYGEEKNSHSLHTLLGLCPKNSASDSKGLIICSPVCFSIPW